MMTLADRVDAFKRAFPARPASWPWLVQEQGHDVLYAWWVLGADYRNRTRYYGAYPHGYLDRAMALFPDARKEARRAPSTVLHVFSGSLPAGPYFRCDVKQPAELRGSVYDLPTVSLLRDHKASLVIADPPYSAADAEKYGTPMIDRRRALEALAQVTAVGGHLVWLDTCWPMHSKNDWRTVGRIAVQRSTNHRARVATIFERKPLTRKGR